MHTINQIYRAFEAIPPGFWAALAASGVLSPFNQFIQHALSWFDKKLTKLEAFCVLSFLAFGGALVQYIIATPTASPKIAILHGAVITFMSQPVYFGAVRPLYAKLTDYLDRKAALKAGVMDAAVSPNAPTADFSA